MVSSLQKCVNEMGNRAKVRFVCLLMRVADTYIWKSQTMGQALIAIAYSIQLLARAWSTSAALRIGRMRRCTTCCLRLVLAQPRKYPTSRAEALDLTPCVAKWSPLAAISAWNLCQGRERRL